MENFTRSATTLKDPEPIGDNAYSVTIFANEMARDGIAIDPDTIDFSNYEKNPVVLYAHDFMGRTDSGGLPIGRTLKLVRAADGQIRADFEFLEGDPFAARVRNAWDRGFLRGASIGWRTEPAGRGGRATKSELIEWSIVAVPADPDALRDAYHTVISALIDAPASHDGADERVVFDHTSRASHATDDHEDPLAETHRLLTRLRDHCRAA